MKALWHVALMAVAVALLVTGGPVQASASETDDRIESSARKSYVFQTYLKDDAIKFESRDGAVILTGTVSEESHKLLAQETVANLPGVMSVDNRLALKVEPAAGNLDTWIGMKVKATLLFHRNLSAAKTDVQVREGIVTLRGEAASPAQMDLTTEYVKDVEGVQGVKNEMTITRTPITPDQKTMGESIDDASITALVKLTLMYHRSTSTIHTRVDTNKGLVTLGGTARNAAEKDLVTKYVQDVHGVARVVNNITIEEPKSKTN